MKNPLLVLMLVVSAANGCGSDDPEESTKESTGTRPVTKESAGRSGSFTPTSAPAATMPEPVACGSTTCTPPASPIASLLGGFGGAAGNIPMPLACCLEPSAGTCGIAPDANSACEALAKPDARCPSLDLGALAMFGGGQMMQATGCCIGNMCGQDGTLLGRGCVENSQAASMLAALPLIGTMLRPPAASACDAAKLSDTDGGI